MRGTVLLLDAGRSSPHEIDVMRADGLLVHLCGRLPEALEHFQQHAVEAVVVRLPREDCCSVIVALREAADHATSIIVSAEPDVRDRAREAGADVFLPSAVGTAELLYEVHRALILRRSGRRLPWNG
jgi:DNA-binding response OmpR family regulator